jgi:hypothetical protein
VSVNVDAVRVDAFIAWLKVAVTVVLTATPVAAPRGVTAVTIGAAGGGCVVVPELPPPQPEITSAAIPTKPAILKRMIDLLLD